MKKVMLFACMGISICFVSCNNDDDDSGTTNPPPPEQTLYEKLGGETMVNDPANEGEMIEQGRLGLRSVVDSSIFVIAADPQLSPFFEVLLAEVGAGNTTGFAALSKSLTDFFAAATGSENFSYNGMDMVSAHDPGQNPRMAMTADDEAFDAFIGAVVIGAQQNDVPANIIQEVGALIETLREPVVQH